MEEDKKKKIIIAAACILAALILAFICLRVFGGVQKSSGKYFDAELRGSGSKVLTLSVKGNAPEGCSWQIREHTPLLDVTEVKNQAGLYKIKIGYAPLQDGEEAISSDFSSTLYLDCMDGESAYSTVALYLNGDGKKLEAVPAAFLSEAPAFTTLESDEDHTVSADDGVYTLTVRIDDDRSVWNPGSYDHSILQVVRAEGPEGQCIFEITGVGGGITELPMIGKRLGTSTILTIESIEATDLDPDGQPVPLGVYELHLRDSRVEPFQKPELTAMLDSFVQTIPGFRLPTGVVPLDAAWYDLVQEGGETFYDLGDKIAYVEAAYGSENLIVYVSDQYTAEQMMSAFPILKELEPSACGDAMIYDASALGEEGGAAVLTEGSTVFLITSRRDASVLPEILETL